MELLRVLADPIRLRVLRLLDHPNRGLGVGELSQILKLPQSTVSRHLKILSETRLLAVRREGTSAHYRLGTRALDPLGKSLRQMARQQLDADPQVSTDEHRLASVLALRQDESEKFFGRSAPRWDTLRRQMFGETFHLEALLALWNEEWVVGDLGTGTGLLLPLLAPHVRQVIGIDASPAMLQAARRRAGDLKNVELRCGRLEELPLEEASLDVAILALVLHHTVDPTLVLEQASRALRPGGRLLIIDLQPHDVELFRQQMGHRWMGFEREELVGWLERAGLESSAWHPLSAARGRLAREKIQVPDLFSLRARKPSLKLPA